MMLDMQERTGVFLGQMRRGRSARWPKGVTLRHTRVAACRWLLYLLITQCAGLSQQPTSPSSTPAPSTVQQPARPNATPQASQTETRPQPRPTEQSVISTG